MVENSSSTSPSAVSATANPNKNTTQADDRNQGDATADEKAHAEVNDKAEHKEVGEGKSG